MGTAYFSGKYAKYLIEGSVKSPDQPTVCYLHGGPGFNSGPERRLLGSKWATQLNCFWIDLLGCHSSPAFRNDEITWKNQIEDLIALLRSLGRGPVHLVCHSFAAHLVHSLLDGAPDLSGNVIFLSPSHNVPLRMKRTIQLGVETGRFPKNPSDLADYHALVGSPDERFGLAETQLFASLFLKIQNAWDLYWKNKEALARYLSVANEYPISIETFVRIHTAVYGRKFDFSVYSSRRVLILQGNCDSITTLEDDARPLADKIPTSKLQLVRDSGHWPHFENPDRVLAEITDFLKNR